ncbi:TRAP transporter small permease subunit [Azospirillum halopraeferens]|uniref:TRAP transporter small permease subunit n=1 Tax=Azospirillum halopraeferens TaxID=34010 RepID=UPI00041F33D4|nr:TRAP transporter small permease [Azospirillum halopraeferens]
MSSERPVTADRGVMTWPAWIFIAIVAVTLYEVGARYLFDAPTIWANELTLFLCAIVFLWSGLYVIRRDEHLRISILYDMAPPRLRRVFDAVALACALVFFGAIAWYGLPTSWRALVTWELYGTAWDPPIPAVLKPLLVVLATAMAVMAVVNFLRRRPHGDGTDTGAL